MGYNKFTCSELGVIINQLQKSYSSIKNEDVRKYTTKIIRSLKARNIQLLDVQVIVRSVITKNPKHIAVLNEDDIDKYVECVYSEGYKWIF